MANPAATLGPLTPSSLSLSLSLSLVWCCDMTHSAPKKEIAQLHPLDLLLDRLCLFTHLSIAKGGRGRARAKEKKM